MGHARFRVRINQSIKPVQRDVECVANAAALEVGNGCSGARAPGSASSRSPYDDAYRCVGPGDADDGAGVDGGGQGCAGEGRAPAPQHASGQLRRRRVEHIARRRPWARCRGACALFWRRKQRRCRRRRRHRAPSKSCGCGAATPR